MAKRELVTVVIPTRNEFHRVGRLLEGLIKQSYRPLEIIVVDGGSTDGTKELVLTYARTYSSRDLTIRLLNEEDYGEVRSPANARNIGILNARGKYIVLFDADFDLRYDTKAIEKIVEGLKKGCKHVAITYKPSMHTWIEKHTALDDIIHYFEGKKPKHIVCAFESSLLRNNLFDASLGFGEDMELLSRVKTKPLLVDTNVYRCYPHTLREKLKQAFWYGRTWRAYCKKVRKGLFKDFVRFNATLGMVILSILFSVIGYVPLSLILLACTCGLIIYRWLLRDYRNKYILGNYKTSLLDRFLWYLFREIVIKFAFNLGLFKSLVFGSTQVSKRVLNLLKTSHARLRKSHTDPDSSS